MATVTQFWAPHEDHDDIFQLWGTAGWKWPLGDNSFYWSFAVRPRNGNAQIEVVRQFTTSDNNLDQVEHFAVLASPFDRNTGSGTALQFTAIKVQEP
jgi:hypothetical protein